MTASYETELMRLLFQLAVVDGDMAWQERESILRRARTRKVPAELISAQLIAMSHGQFPAPDMAVLRTDVSQTRAAARTLLAIDGVLHDKEIDAFQRLDVALSM